MCCVLSCSVVSNSVIPWTVYSPPGFSVHGNSPGKNTGVGCNALLQRILPTQRSNAGLPHCRRILHCLSHQGSPFYTNILYYLLRRRAVRALVGKTARRLQRAQAFRRFDKQTSVLLIYDNMFVKFSLAQVIWKCLGVYER